MKIDTLAPLVDVQPLYDALAEMKSNLIDDEDRRYLLHKIQRSCAALARTAKYVKEQLGEVEPLVKSPSKRARKTKPRGSRYPV